MMELFAPDAVAALFQVVVIDLSLAGDNAIVVGMAAAGLPQEQRTRAILFGMMGATVLLVLFAGITTQLLRLVGLMFAGGVLLLWVCWKMWRELRWSVREEEEAVEALTGYDINADGTIAGCAPRKTLGQAAGQIIIADLSMSLDNVLAVAGAAREHPFRTCFRAHPVNSVDGRRRDLHRPPAAEIPLDRLCRFGGHSLRRSRDGLPGRARIASRRNCGQPAFNRSPNR